jgi:hypothetical protein
MFRCRNREGHNIVAFSPRDLTELALWLDERQAAHKAEHRDHAKRAMLDLYNKKFGSLPKSQRPPASAFISTTKKLWSKGRRYREQRQQMLTRVWGSRRKGGE